VAALPPQPPGSLPPEPPGVAPPGGPPPVGPPQGPYSPGGAYAGQMPAQPYVSQPMPQPVVVKVHKRTFWLTIAQIIIILKAILIILLAAASVAIGLLVSALLNATQFPAWLVIPLVVIVMLRTSVQRSKRTQDHVSVRRAR